VTQGTMIVAIQLSTEELIRFCSNHSTKAILKFLHQIHTGFYFFAPFCAVILCYQKQQGTTKTNCLWENQYPIIQTKNHPIIQRKNWKT